MRRTSPHVSRRKNTPSLLVATSLLLALALSALFLVGCDLSGTDTDETAPPGGEDVLTSSVDGTNVPTNDDTSQVTTSETSNETIELRVYFARDEKMAAAERTVPKTLQTGAAAMEALIQGPTAEENEAGMFSAVPADTDFLGLDIKSGVATVDLSQEFASGGRSLSMFTRLAQVVFTLTQFPSVDSVRFKLDGELLDTLGGEGIMVDEPLGREDLEDMSPAILVETPTVGATVTSPLRVAGTANVFEATFQVNIVDWDGKIIAEQTVMATSGSGTRGTFDVTVPFDVSQEGLGALIVFAESPRDGSQIDVVEIPLDLAK